MCIGSRICFPAVLALSAAAFFGPIAQAGSGAKSLELDWAISAGGNSSDQGTGIAIDPGGNSYVTGLFEETATFGAGEGNETVLTSAGGTDVFVAKYGRDGALLWATRAGGDSSVDQGLGIATDPGGNSYVTGHFVGTARFGVGEVKETVLTSAGGNDVFVAKYARNGTLLWATSAGGSNSAEGRGIATDHRGNSYVTGVFFGAARFGAGEENETVLTSAGGNDVFVAKYARNGTLLWATSAGGSDPSDLGVGIATDPPGNSYVTGTFRGAATFGAGEENKTVLTSAGSGDVFVAKYGRNGALLWAVNAGGSSLDEGLGIATDPRGNSYVAGRFAGTAKFGAGENNEVEVSSAGQHDVFVAKYARDGTLLWATSAGGSGPDEGLGIATDPRGDSYVTGFFVGTATFGAGEDNETLLNGVVGGDVFVAKYGRNGALLWATSAGGSAGASGRGIATDPRGNNYVTGFFRGTAAFGADGSNATVLTSVGGTDVFVSKYHR